MSDLLSELRAISAIAIRAARQQERETREAREATRVAEQAARYTDVMAEFGDAARTQAEAGYTELRLRFFPAEPGYSVWSVVKDALIRDGFAVNVSPVVAGVSYVPPTGCENADVGSDDVGVCLCVSWADVP